MNEAPERDFGGTTRTPDCGFVARQRAKGTPEATIARMGGWCLADVQAVPMPRVFAVESKPKPKAVPLTRHEMLSDPDVHDILRHVADQYMISTEDVLGHSHAQEYVEPRHEAFAVVWELNRFTLHELAVLFNKTRPGITYGLQCHYQRLRERGPGRDW